MPGFRISHCSEKKNKQDSDYNKVLNMPRVLNYQGCEYASSSEYTRVLNVKDL